MAPDITPEALAARGWTTKDLQQFFMTGIAPQGSAFSDMHPVIYLSSQHLTPEDNKAIATYLMGDNPPATSPLNIGEGSPQGTKFTWKLALAAIHTMGKENLMSLLR